MLGLLAREDRAEGVTRKANGRVDVISTRSRLRLGSGIAASHAVTGWGHLPTGLSLTDDALETPPSAAAVNYWPPLHDRYSEFDEIGDDFCSGVHAMLAAAILHCKSGKSVPCYPASGKACGSMAPVDLQSRSWRR